MMNIPPEAQQLLLQLEQLRQQYNIVSTQRMSLEGKKAELENAIKELESTDEEYVYKNVGAILVKKPRVNVLEELKEDLDTVTVRIGALKKQETSIIDRIKALQNKINELLSGAGNVG